MTETELETVELVARLKHPKELQRMLDEARAQGQREAAMTFAVALMVRTLTDIRFGGMR